MGHGDPTEISLTLSHVKAGGTESREHGETQMPDQKRGATGRGVFLVALYMME